jgi:uncharacterized repeat protein (TIGR03843 family)
VGDPLLDPHRGPDAELQEALRHDAPRALAFLQRGALEVVGRLTEASNATLYCTMAEEASPAGTVRPAGTTRQAPRVTCVYKPIRGERPLDDFPRGTLAHREVAAFLVSECSGWRIVPPTVLRDGPFGPGMVQLWIEVDPDIDTPQLILTRDARLRPMAVFDAVVENADRKGGHVLPTTDGHLYGCDHGVCFSTDPKLRTVLWGWRGEDLLEPEIAGLRRIRAGLDGELTVGLSPLLTQAEIRMTVRRVDRLLRERTMPLPDPLRPVIPWPPF